MMRAAALLLLAPVHTAIAQSPAARLFAERCASCHGDDASGSDRGPALARSRSLRSRPIGEIRNVIRNGTAGGMPPFALPETDLAALAIFVASMNASAIDAHLPGDTAAGERLFWGKAQCGSCHTAMGRGKTVGPDLSTVGRQLTAADLSRKLQDAAARPASGYAPVTARLRDGSTVHGYARKETLHSLQLQTADGRLLLLAEGEYEISARDLGVNPHVLASPEEQRDLLAFVSRLGGLAPGALTGPVEPVDPAAIETVLHPRAGEWPTYNGAVGGNRYSTLKQIDRGNVSRLAARWSYTIPYFGLEATPLVSDGVMYVSGPNQVHALDARTGEQIWVYSRPRTTSPTVAGDAAKGANRGVALLGDRIFVTTDDAHLLCLDRLNGALRWDVYMPEQPQHYASVRK